MKKFMRATYALAAAVSFAMLFAAPGLAQTTEPVAVLRSFSYQTADAAVRPDSLRSDGAFIGFVLEAADGRAYRVRLQVTDGRPESFDDAGDEAPGKPLPGGQESGGEWIERICEGGAVATARCSFAGRKFYAAAGLDRAVYLISPRDRKQTAPAIVHKFYLGTAPKAILAEGNRFFVVREGYLDGFEIVRARDARNSRAAIESFAGTDHAGLLASTVTRVSADLGTGFSIDCVTSDHFRFDKASPATQKPGSAVSAYFTGGFGGGNRNLYSLGEDMSIARISAFSGEITDFAEIPAKPGSFIISHRRSRSDDGAGRWQFTPPAVLAKVPPGTGEGEPDERVVARAFSPGSYGYEVRIEGTGENAIFKLHFLAARSGVTPPSETLDIPMAARHRASPDFRAAVTAFAGRPYFAFYNPMNCRVYVIDAAKKFIHDSRYFAPRLGTVCELSFTGDGSLLVIRTAASRALDGTGPSSIFVYRPESRSLARVGDFRRVAGMSLFERNGAWKALVVFGKRSSENDSLGIIGLR